MITAYCRGLLTIWWPRWKQFTRFLRWFLPIVMHLSQLSLVNWVASCRRSIGPDAASTIFVTSASLALLRFRDLTVEPYKPSLRYFDSFVQVVLQIIYVDLSARFILIPISYFLYYFCSGGYVAYILDKYFFAIYVCDGYLPVSKFAQISKTKEGYEILRIVISVFTLICSILWSRLYRELYSAYKSIESTTKFLLAPLLDCKKPSSLKKTTRDCWLF